MQTSNVTLLAAIVLLTVTGAVLAGRVEAQRSATEQAAGWLRSQVTSIGGREPVTLRPVPAPVDEVDRTGGVDLDLGGPPTGTDRAARVAWDDRELGRRGRDALNLIDYPWQERLPEWEIRFHADTEGAYGYTLTREAVIDIYVRDDQSTQLLAHVIAHELGHAVDVTLNDGDDRRRWQELRGIESSPWWPDSRASDFATGAGDFAESFAAWQVGTDSYRSELADPPTAAQQAVVAELATS